MAAFTLPSGHFGEAAQGFDGVSTATPLAHFRDTMGTTFQALDFQEVLGNLFLGNVAGCLGETSALALLSGAGFLWYRHMLGFKVPFTYVTTVFVLFWLFSGTGNPFTTDALTVAVYQVLSGGLMLGALFMASDVVTSPITPRGKVVFGFGCGVLTFGFRVYGGYPEGVCYSILLMNCVAPLIDRYTRPRRYGEARKRG
jgi:electron transport complex protein RnfD